MVELFWFQFHSNFFQNYINHFYTLSSSSYLQLYHFHLNNRTILKSIFCKYVDIRKFFSLIPEGSSSTLFYSWEKSHRLFITYKLSLLYIFYIYRTGSFCTALLHLKALHSLVLQFRHKLNRMQLVKFY